MTARLVVIIALIVTLIVIAITFVVSVYVQPILPSGTNAVLIVLFAAVLGVLAVFSQGTGFLNNLLGLIEKLKPKHIENMPHPDPKTGQQATSRQPDSSELQQIAKRLSEKAQELLMKASEDPEGKVLTVLGAIQVRGKQLLDRHNPREVAAWQAALSELVDVELLRALTSAGQVFLVTDEGYKVADLLKALPTSTKTEFQSHIAPQPQLALKFIDGSHQHRDEISFEQTVNHQQFHFGIALVNDAAGSSPAEKLDISIECFWDGSAISRAPHFKPDEYGRTTPGWTAYRELVQQGQEPMPAVLAFHGTADDRCAYGHPKEWFRFSVILAERMDGRFLLYYKISSGSPQTESSGELRIVIHPAK